MIRLSSKAVLAAAGVLLALACLPAAQAQSKTVLYAWAGPDQPSASNRDFVSVVEIPVINGVAAPQDATIGYTVDTPIWASEPHHVGLNGVPAAADTLATGSLFAYRAFKGVRDAPTDDISLFDISNPARPTWVKGVRGARGAVVDSFLPWGGATDPDALANGGSQDGRRLLVTLMGDRRGRTPGKLGILRRPTNTPGDSAWTLARELEGGLNNNRRADRDFAPHGMDRVNSTLVTADYVAPYSVWRDSREKRPIYQSTARVWNLSHPEGPTVVSVWDLQKNDRLQKTNGDRAAGLMSVRYTGKDQLFYVSAGLGQLLLLDASARHGSKIENVIRPVYSLAGGNVIGSCVMSPIGPASSPEKRMVVTTLALDQVRILNVTDPAAPTTLFTYQLKRGAQPHVVVVNADWTVAAVSTYYVDQNPAEGLAWTTPAEKAVHLFSIVNGDDGAFKAKLVLSTTFDFTKHFPSRGVTRPHGIVFGKTIPA